MTGPPGCINMRKQRIIRKNAAFNCIIKLKFTMLKQ